MIPASAGKTGMYRSFHSWINAWMAGKTVWSLDNACHLSASWWGCPISSVLCLYLYPPFFINYGRLVLGYIFCSFVFSWWLWVGYQCSWLLEIEWSRSDLLCFDMDVKLLKINSSSEQLIIEFGVCFCFVFRVAVLLIFSWWIWFKDQRSWTLTSWRVTDDYHTAGLEKNWTFFAAAKVESVHGVADSRHAVLHCESGVQKIEVAY